MRIEHERNSELLSTLVNMGPGKGTLGNYVLLLPEKMTLDERRIKGNRNSIS